MLNAIKTLTTLKVEEGDVKGGSDHIRKEIMTTGLDSIRRFLFKKLSNDRPFTNQTSEVKLKCLVNQHF